MSESVGRRRGDIDRIRSANAADSFTFPCPVENVHTMLTEVSGPAGLRWKCSQCGVVVVIPRASLRKAIRRVWK